jgi:hypothetical protein
VSCRVVSCRVVSCRVVSCRVVSCRVVSCRVISWTSPEPLAIITVCHRAVQVSLESVVGSREPEVLTFLHELLQWDPNKRPTARAAMSSPLFAVSVRVCVTVTLPLDAVTRSRFLLRVLPPTAWTRA